MKKQQVTVFIKSIEIIGLFDLFDYDIKYPTQENVLILTGPNGFGKTQILNIVFNLFNQNFLFFDKLVFKKITVRLSGNIEIVVDKTEVEKLHILFYENDEELEVLNIWKDIEQLKTFDRKIESRRIVLNTKEEDSDLPKFSNAQDVFDRYRDYFREGGFPQNLLEIKNRRVHEILDSVNTHLIREQRLFKKVEQSRRQATRRNDETVMIETIKVYADELKVLMSEKFQDSFNVSQELDRTYPSRLITEKRKISKTDYDARFLALHTKQKELAKNGLYENQQETLDYSEDDAKALLVYLDDLEKKLSVFDDLLEKLKLFTNILNERRFIYKSIIINPQNGFYFQTSKGKKLDLSELSSGEQHEVVLLYELIFKTKTGIIVLIDEPEISLHVTWQKEFINDLLQIIKNHNFQVLIATHSPSIINSRWDLVYNLQKRWDDDER